MMMVINNVKDFINGELLAHLYASGDQVWWWLFMLLFAIEDLNYLFTPNHRETDTNDGGESRGGGQAGKHAQDVSRLQGVTADYRYVLGILYAYTLCITWRKYFSISSGDVSRATVTMPVPPPVKNDWLSGGMDNPRLSPPSPGGPRKAQPVQQVSDFREQNNLLNESPVRQLIVRNTFDYAAGLPGQSRPTSAASHITRCSSHSKSSGRFRSAIARRTTSRRSGASCATDSIVSSHVCPFPCFVATHSFPPFPWYFVSYELIFFGCDFGFVFVFSMGLSFYYGI